MATQLTLGGVSVDVLFKDIKNLHLSVHPPSGRIRISAPQRMKMDAVRLFAISKIDWIKQQQLRFHDQDRETPREFLERESHYLWGRRYLLKVVESETSRGIELAHRTMLLRVRRNTDHAQRQAVLSRFYRDQLCDAVPVLLKKWQTLVGVDVDRFFIRHMKTKWGSCNPKTRTIRLNTELAKKPDHCLEYIVVHELVHMLVPRHSDRFIHLMDRFIPEWRHLRDELNWQPLVYEEWKHS